MKLIFLISLAFWNFHAAQASVIKLIKKSRVVVIDDDSVTKGDKVCFYDGSKKKACGKVVKVKSDKSYVRIKSRKHFRRVKKDMSHEVVSASGGSSLSRGGKNFVFRLLATPSLFARSSLNYTKMNFDGGKPTGFTEMTNEEITRNESEMGKMARLFPWMSGGLEAGMNVTKSIHVAMGGRYTQLNLPPSVDSYFLEDKNSKAEYLDSEYKGHELSFWLDCFFLDIKDLGLKIGMGGEFTMSNVSVSTSKSKDTEFDAKGAPTKTEVVKDKFYTGKSSANVMSARLLLRKDFPLGAYGFSLGLNLIVSPLAMGGDFTLDGEPDILDEAKNVWADKNKFIENVKDTMDHTNNIFSAVLAVSFYFSI